MPEVYVSIGSNIDREANVESALGLMGKLFGSLRVSSVYEAEAVGFEGPNFYNLVVGFETDLALAEIVGHLNALEIRRGRRRGLENRTLDLDILLYGDTVDHAGPVDVPRPDILKYAFVLRPLAEIAGHLIHPECGRGYAELWADFGDPNQKVWPAMAPMDHAAPERRRVVAWGDA